MPGIDNPHIRTHYSIPLRLLERFNAWAEETSQTRSGAVAQIIREKLDALDGAQRVPRPLLKENTGEDLKNPAEQPPKASPKPLKATSKPVTGLDAARALKSVENTESEVLGSALDKLFGKTCPHHKPMGYCKYGCGKSSKQ